MTFRWRDYFELAKELSQNTDEASSRTAISRAYYSLICHARDALTSRSFNITRGPECHTEVIQHYKSSNDFESKKIATTLERLRLRRNSADYDSVFDKDYGTLEKAVEAATNISTERCFGFVDSMPDNIFDEIKSNYSPLKRR